MDKYIRQQPFAGIARSLIHTRFSKYAEEEEKLLWDIPYLEGIIPDLMDVRAQSAGDGKSYLFLERDVRSLGQLSRSLQNYAAVRDVLLSERRISDRHADACDREAALALLLYGESLQVRRIDDARMQAFCSAGVSRPFCIEAPSGSAPVMPSFLFTQVMDAFDEKGRSHLSSLAEQSCMLAANAHSIKGDPFMHKALCNVRNAVSYNFSLEEVLAEDPESCLQDLSDIRESGLMNFPDSWVLRSLEQAASKRSAAYLDRILPEEDAEELRQDMSVAAVWGALKHAEKYGRYGVLKEEWADKASRVFLMREILSESLPEYLQERTIPAVPVKQADPSEIKSVSAADIPAEELPVFQTPGAGEPVSGTQEVDAPLWDDEMLEDVPEDLFLEEQEIWDGPDPEL